MTRTRVAVGVAAAVVLTIGFGGWYLLAPRHRVWLDPATNRWNVYHRSGFRIGDRGARATFEGTSPHWENATPLQAEVERIMRESVANMATEFGGEITRDMVLETIGEPSAVMEWEANAQLTVTLDTPTLISVLYEYSAYTGGAHGYSLSGDSVFAWRDGKAELIGLGDVLDESNAPVMRRLRLLVFRDLKAQGATGMQKDDPGDAGDPPVSDADLSTFTLHPEGLRFHFDPYHVGSYAEGKYEVTLPWEVVRPLLRADSPVTRWLDERGE